MIDIPVHQYRKKPVVIEAVELSYTGGATLQEIADWCNGTADPISRGIKIKTLEGEMFASMHDYIIKGVNGEFYPCKPDIFNKTYEEVADADSKTSS